jgi:hypothetical protein
MWIETQVIFETSNRNRTLRGSLGIILMFISTNSGEEKAGLQRNPRIFNDPH